MWKCVEKCQKGVKMPRRCCPLVVALLLFSEHCLRNPLYVWSLGAHIHSLRLLNRLNNLMRLQLEYLIFQGGALIWLNNAVRAFLFLRFKIQLGSFLGGQCRELDDPVIAALKLFNQFSSLWALSIHGQMLHWFALPSLALPAEKGLVLSLHTLT